MFEAYQMIMAGFRTSGFVIVMILSGCYPDESLNVAQKEYDPLNTELDNYIQEHFTDRFGVAVRYKYQDNFVRPGQRVAPVHLDSVMPMLNFIDEYWVDPYLEVEGGEEFFSRYVPAELVLLGGLIYNGDGTVTLGVADAGARITFTNVNAIDPEDEDWRDLQLQTTYHEFAHTVHQEFKLPNSFETISQSGYTSPGSWFTLTDEEALDRGFVSPYATSSVNEDFAETVAFFLFDDEFYEKFINQDEDCVTAECVTDNAGKALIFEKLVSIMDHYTKVTGLDLEEIRAAVQSRL